MERTTNFVLRVDYTTESGGDDLAAIVGRVLRDRLPEESGGVKITRVEAYTDGGQLLEIDDEGPWIRNAGRKH